MSNKYEYLKPYLPPHEKYDEANRNWFFPVTEEEVQEGEELLKNKFPSELREFYQEIGYGSLYSPSNASKSFKADCSNLILPPLVVAKFSLNISEHQSFPKECAQESSGFWLSLEALELFEPGDLPFLEISDSSIFMVMKLNSDNPNAVWFMGHEKIEDSFERFIWKLYYEGPNYYAKDW